MWNKTAQAYMSSDFFAKNYSRFLAASQLQKSTFFPKKLTKNSQKSPISKKKIFTFFLRKKSLMTFDFLILDLNFLFKNPTKYITSIKSCLSINNSQICHFYQLKQSQFGNTPFLKMARKTLNMHFKTILILLLIVIFML